MKMREIYNKQINWNKTKSDIFMNEPRIKKMLSLVETNQKVLDIGCYTGDISLAIKEKGNAVIGLDCNTEFVKMSKNKGIDARFANFEEKFPIKSNSIDLVFAGEIIEHIYNTEIFLKECNRVLKKNGSLIISTPNINYWVYRLKMLFGKTLPYGIEAGNESEFPGHIRYYTFESLIKTTNKFGFKQEVITSSSILERNNLKVTFLSNIIPTIGYHIIIKTIKKKELK
jgi:ubiquinone/menaquinone biosynthesis C-methylase UbiE